MLKEVHEWFTKNLKHNNGAASAPQQSTPFPGGVETGSQLPAAGLTFTVSEMSQVYGADLSLRCTQATFHPRWHTDMRLFQCRCQQDNHFQTRRSAFSKEIHEDQLQYLRMKPFLYFIKGP